MNETATTGEQHDDLVKIRPPRIYWIYLLVIAGWCFVLGAGQEALGWPWFAAVGCLSVGAALWIRTDGVDLTPESAIIRSVRRRNIPWQDVQAVLRYQRHDDDWGVRLILEGGEPVRLRVPRTWGGFGGARYEREFHRIGQSWLAHRGESWRPLRPEAPGPPLQG